ncbi:MAG TPA: hypothetical protein VLJ10_04075 [Candidatus Bathyarchaeia archaeon]|nr:hypothetical protein [Candidatus Bathyarchaeia archaeon]
MKVGFENLGDTAVDMIRRIGAYADQQGVRAFLVGGIVRDLFLRRDNKDIDVVVETDAIDFARRFAVSRSLNVVAHPQFRTATLCGASGLHVDFVTARKERYPRPGALPMVTPAGLSQDLFRRDFTINALAASINALTFGQVMDEYHGLTDIKRGVIRVFHERSFIDDPTRILRAVRFEQRLGFRFSPSTRRWLGEAIKARAEQTVSEPRYFKEFARGLIAPGGGKYLIRLSSLGALKFLGTTGGFPRELLRRLDRRLSLFMKKGVPEFEAAVVYLSALFYRQGPQAVTDLARTFQWPRSWTKGVLAVLTAIDKWRGLSDNGAGQDEWLDFFQRCDLEGLLFLRVAILDEAEGRVCDQILKRRNRQ